MRTTRRNITIAVLLGIAVAVVFVILSRDSEPRYQGRRLSDWVESYAIIAPLDEVNRAPTQAVRAIGTNALPFLLDWIRYEPSNTKRSLYRTLERFHLRMNDHAEARADSVASAFRILGPIAEPAIPELTKLASASSNKEAAERATFALTCIGPTALPALVKVIKNTNAVARYEAVLDLNYGLREFGSDAYPILVDCLDDPDARVALESADALSNAGVEPAIVCVKITRHLRHPDWWQRFRALQIVGHYRGQAREQARVIIPDLLATLADTNSTVRQQSESILRRIAPEVLTNAPAH